MSLKKFLSFLQRFVLVSKLYFNARYVTEKSSTDAKSIELIGYASNLLLLWDLQQLYCKQWPRNVCHHVTTFFFESASETNGACDSLITRAIFQQTCGINNANYKRAKGLGLL